MFLLNLCSSRVPSRRNPAECAIEQALFCFQALLCGCIFDVPPSLGSVGGAGLVQECGDAAPALARAPRDAELIHLPGNSLEEGESSSLH